MKRAPGRNRQQQSTKPRHVSELPAATFSTKRKWLLRLSAIFIPPLVVLGGLELLLRLVGYGFDPHFFKRANINGNDYYVDNEDFGRRFFPRSLARVAAPTMMPAIKAPGTFRIFIFGESAALGDPRPNYGAGCYLEALLAERFPQARFEIINTAVTAINSHAILPIAQECAGHQGDLWILYMGNNEMVGPFGAATVFGARAPPLWLIRTQLQLQRLRLGQLLFAACQKLHKANPSSTWAGMEMFLQNQIPPNDPRKARVYNHFGQNLDAIVNTGLAAGARIILSTVAVNLKDCPPFGSLSPADLPSTERTAYEQLCREGTNAQALTHFAEAQARFQRATEIYPKAAEAQFQLATCLLRLTNGAAMARSHFRQAVDNDTLPFRADSQINDKIRTAARHFASDSLALCDVSETLDAIGPDEIPGQRQFYEHVHLNPQGNYALALTWAGQVEKLLGLKPGTQDSWLPQARCDQLLGLSDWNRVSILQEIFLRLQRPPFSSQSGNVKWVAGLRDAISEMRQRLTANAAAEARETYLRALRRSPQNFRLHENYAEFLEATHDLNSAIAERKKVCELIPFFYFPFYSLGADLKEAGELSQAREALLKAAALKPEQGETRLELGIVCARQGQWDTARQELEEARRLVPGDPQVPLYLGEVLWKLDRRDEALASLRDASRLAPLDWQPHYRLASDLAQEGSFSNAAVEYQEALRLSPANIKTKLGLAAVLLNLGRQAEAIQQLDEALQLQPTNQAVLDFRRKLGGL